jgi:hypothetical protein
MGDRDFSIFERTIAEIIHGIGDADREALKRRINTELDHYESQAHSEVHPMSVETRRRIRTIERKALARLGEHLAQPLEQGRQCTLCEQYESDIRLVPLGNVHAVCADCIKLVKEIVDQGKNDAP